jgi:small GTP-binding protein
MTSLPPEIWELPMLKGLYISDNPLPEIPIEIWQRDDWEDLGLGKLCPKKLPPALFRLTQLRFLSISENDLKSLPPDIGQLANLKGLNLAGNQLECLPPEIGELTNLTWLDILGNQLGCLPPEIGQLTNLITLSLSNNKLTSLPPEIGQLTSLKELYLYDQGNQLVSLPSEIGKLISLTALYLSGNHLMSLPPELGQLTNLTELDLSFNHLTSLPREIVDLQNLKDISLRQNPLQIAIPAKWRGDHPQEILAYYKRMYEEGGRELGEARILVVGDGRVGKTSLVKRLIDNTFDKNEDSTLIVEKRPLLLGDLRAQVWDFGGQEHMHATHQFFFSGRSLYLLVFDTGKTLEQNNVEYWLTLINAYSQNAPVILVGNKCDQHEMDIEKRRLREKFPDIRGFVGTSASTGEHIEELRQTIQEEVRAMPQVRVLFSADYLAVKDEMENLRAAHISHEEFVRVCERHGVSDAKDQDTLLDLLHDLGTILYFRDADGNPLLPALGVLNPNWVTRGVYLIVTNPALKDKFKGRLSKDLLREILSAPEYSRHIEDIAKLLERFELCYRADDSAYWLPSLMEKDEPAALGDFTSVMKFEYVYPELPKSVIVRFIVKAHKMILGDKVWRYGAVLKLDGNTALVRADERDKRVSIFLAGEESTRRDALAILRAHFDDIHAMFAAPPEAFIYPPQYPDLRLPFEQMKTLAKTERERTEVYNGKPVTINLRDLLEGYVTLEEKRKDEEKEERNYMKTEKERPNVTVNVQGDLHGGAITIGDNNKVTQTVQGSFNKTELHETLEQLDKAVSEMLPHLPAEEAESVKDDLARLKEEAAKPKPQKRWYSVSIEGLSQAAKNLNELGTPVVTLAGKVLKLLTGLE